MKIVSAIVVFAVLMVQSGCSTYSVDRINHTPGPGLNPSGSAYVSLCEDASFNSKIYQGSGFVTSRIISDTLSKHLSHVEKGKDPESCDEALDSALYGGHDYLVCPSILQWEDHDNVRDRLSIKILVIDTLTGVKIDAVIINGKSKLLPSGKEKPQDLLATPVMAYIDSLFQ